MEETLLDLHTRFVVGDVDPRIFGGFLEHMGRAVYEGVYDPDSPHADEDGLRTDVLEALRRLRMPIVRYPGGNFASGYHWRDGVGPPEQRPTVRELAWQSIEPNRFGTEEFMTLCRKAGWLAMLTVNLGTGTPEEARNWVEYCNLPTGTRYADMRAANGSEQPHGAPLWCLGNEMDGPWQLGHMPAEDYAVLAGQAAKMMVDADPSIEVVACGSSGPSMDTYLEWDRKVLEYLGDRADYISAHRYVSNNEGDTADYLAVTNAIDRQIEQVDAVCRCAAASRSDGGRAYISFDEWNAWAEPERKRGDRDFAPHLAECVYSLEDALVVAGFLHSFLRHADAVKVANIAQVVNVLGPVLTKGDQMLIQPIFYPFEMMSTRARGASLRTAVWGPTYEGRTNGEVHVVDASAVDGGEKLHVFLTNRSHDSEAPVRVRVADRRLDSVEDAAILTGPGPKVTNTHEEPEVVRSHRFEDVGIEGGEARAALPPLSFAALTFNVS
jgi:alpha-N-arabinofuranosidase